MSDLEVNPRFQKIDKISLLAHCPLFAGLSQWELKSIGQLMRLVEYKKDDVVYKEGGEAGSFYVVVSGRFEAFVNDHDKKKVLAYLRRGDYFGEMSLLTNQPHSATLHALSDSLTLELKKEDFKRTIETNATISLELSRRLSTRLKGSDSRTSPLFKSDVISVFTNQPGASRSAFAINLAASLFRETRQKTVLLDMSPSGAEISTSLHVAKKVPLTHFQEIENAATGALSDLLVKHPAGFDLLSVAHTTNDALGENIIVSLLNHLAIDYRFILIHLNVGLDGAVYKVLTQSDSIYFVTDSHMNDVSETRQAVAEIEKELAFPENKIAVVINEVFLGMRTTANTKRELFGKKLCYSLPTLPGLQERGGIHAASGVEDPDSEYARVVRHIARHISGNLVGLVLGSGAALGLAHVGVLKVLEREKIPVDLIAGSSIGALIASLYAVGRTAAEIEQAAMEITARLLLTRLMDVNLFPLRGLLHGDSVMKHFGKHLGQSTFDDCRIPLRVTAANLSMRQVQIIDSGFVSDAVRASIAIPAIFKPIIKQKDVIVDGGILSPLPIRALAAAGANKIIAVNVFPSSKDTMERRVLADEAAEKEELVMRQKNFFLRALSRVNRAVARRFSHNIFDVLMTTIQSMEAEIAEVEGEQADVLLRPVVPEANWVQFYKPAPFIKRGEDETMRMLSKIKALVYQQNV